jgi:hypothetical protein
MHIITRKEWGARYPDGFGPLKPPAAEVWLHHTGGTEPDNAMGIRQLEQVGQDRFGGGCSYTFLAGQSGTVYEGTTPNREGAHTLGHNSVGRAICWIGNFSAIKPTEQIIEATVVLLVLGRNSGWWTHAALNGGHRDVYNTACPGDHAYAVIGEINRRAASVANGPIPDPAGPNSIPTMKRGQTSEAIRRLQSFMNRAFRSYSHMLGNPQQPLLETGYYGDSTTGVIREFQRRVGIAGVGGEVADPMTKAKLFEHGFHG